MTLAYAAERRLRQPRHEARSTTTTRSCPGRSSPAIMHLPHVTAREEHDLGLALRWSYGSAFGLWHGVLRRRVGEPWASLGVRRRR